MKQDIQRKLSVDIGFLSDTTATIIAHIFERKNGSAFFEGLVDSNSEDECDSKQQSLESTWAKFEDCRAKKSDNKIMVLQVSCRRDQINHDTICT